MSRSHKYPNQVNIAKLKTHLGHYLKSVREGEEIVILDRQTPVAKLVAFSDTFDLENESTPAKKTWKSVLASLHSADAELKPSPLKKSVQVYLQEDRSR